MNKIDKKNLLIFDLDDTLVYSKLDFAQIGQEIREEIFLRQILAEEMDQLASMSVSQILQLVEKDDSQRGSKNALELWKIVEDAERVGAERATIHEDTKEVLEKLKNAGDVLTIFTNNSQSVAQFVLKKFGLFELMDKVITRDDVQSLKPHPEGLLFLREKFKALVHEMFFIGDSWIDGIAANKAKIPFIGFNCQEPRGIEMLHNVSSLSELAIYLNNTKESWREGNAI